MIHSPAAAGSLRQLAVKSKRAKAELFPPWRAGEEVSDAAAARPFVVSGTTGAYFGAALPLCLLRDDASGMLP
jgi:hypothetical protein